MALAKWIAASGDENVEDFVESFLQCMCKYNHRWNLPDFWTQSLSTWNAEDFVGYIKIENVYSEI